MTKRKHDGRSSDMTFSWLTRTYGEGWLQWQEYAAEWMATQDGGVDAKLGALMHFFVNYLMQHAAYAQDVTAFFRGHAGHQVTTDEFVEAMQAAGLKVQRKQALHVAHINNFIEHIIAEHFRVEDDNGVLRPIVVNPFHRITSQRSASETVKNPLPYRYIQQLRQILCPYPHANEHGESEQDIARSNPWAGRHFRDWTWAHDRVRFSWYEVDPEAIDRNDPDCVWRTKTVQRDSKQVTIHQMWSPVTAMALFVKLHLPLRTYQVRFLDSGEADTWRYEGGRWVANNHPFAYGSTKRPYSKGVFRRTYDSMTETYGTSLYISTNKTADQNKDEMDRGYTIPWQHEELLYWLEKLRNWQEKYNSISDVISADTLDVKHTTNLKSDAALKAMGEYCFLFRDASAKDADDRAKPLSDISIKPSWYRLLGQLEQNLAATGHTLSDGSSLKLVEDYPEDVREEYKVKTLFPLHSLRVSLITAYTMDTALPLPVVSKLLAGHTRLLMKYVHMTVTKTYTIFLTHSRARVGLAA